MIRMNPNSRVIGPDTVMSYDWFNGLQDEICTVIEKRGDLSQKLDQLSSTIHEMISGSGMSLGEVADYSGNPVPIPGLTVKHGDVLSFYLSLDIGLKTPGDLSLDQLPSSFKPFLSAPQTLDQWVSSSFYELDTSSANFASLAPVLSSNDLLGKKQHSFGDTTPDDPSFNSYEPMKLPEIPNTTRSEVVSWVRRMNVKRLMDRQTSIVPYVFALTQNGISSTHESFPFTDYTAVQSMVPSLFPLLSESPKDRWEDAARSWPLYYFFSGPMPPVVLAANADGQIFYLFNKMMYGDYLRVKLGVLNLTKISV